MTSPEGAVPIEDFVQALQAQLDRAQRAMHTKARNLNLPLTFALKDISIDLRTHVEVVKNQVRVRPAGAGDHDASVLHLTLTTVTRPMIEENAFAMDTSEERIDEVQDIPEEDRRKLEWAGLQTVRQLKEMHDESGEASIGRMANLPIDRLRKALQKMSQPLVSRVETEQGEDPAQQLLRIRGQNLMRSRAPKVEIEGMPVSVLQANDREVLIAPLAHQFGGILTIETEPNYTAQAAFDLRPSLKNGAAQNGAAQNQAATNGAAKGSDQ
jgi:hypothetical protein